MKMPFSKSAATPPATSSKRAKPQGKASDKGPSRRQWLALRPIRNPDLEWMEENGQVVLTIRRTQNWKTRMLNLLVPLPAQHRVVLDRIGSDVWRFSDGEHSVEHIARALAERYKIEVREAELSLQQFFKELGRRGYVGFRIETSG